MDRLGFFSDADQHSNRVINIGLSYAYRHFEVDTLATASALCLKDLRVVADSAANALGGCGTTGRVQSEEPTSAIGLVPEQPAIGIVVAARSRVDAHVVPPARVNPPGAGGADGGGADAYGTDTGAYAILSATEVTDAGDGSLIVPVGGLVFRGGGKRHGAAADTGREHLGDGRQDALQASAVSSEPDGDVMLDAVPPKPDADVDLDAALLGGGFVVARRLPLARGTLPMGTSPSFPLPICVDVAAGRQVVSQVAAADFRSAKNVRISQTTVTPSAAAIECVKSVLRELQERADVWDVL